jgi:flagellar biosynthesis chaperone FliJ
LARDPLAVLWRLREAAVTEASAALAGSRARVLQAASLVEQHNAEMSREQADATWADGPAFADWLPHARRRAASLCESLRHEEIAVQQRLVALTQRRTEAEAVAKALLRQRTSVALVAARREQAEMDEAAGNSGCGKAFG